MFSLSASCSSEGGTTAAILNAANEVAVAAFLHNQLRFDRIADVIDATLQSLPATRADELETVLESDRHARILAQQQIRDANRVMIFDTLQTILAFVITLGILVSIHEFGHFRVARRAGVKALHPIGFAKCCGA